MIDAKLRADILATISEAMEVYKEEYLTADMVTERFPMFTREWLKRYGHSLPRTHAVVTDEHGEKHQTRWVYPAHKIARMIADGEVKNLRCLSVRRPMMMGLAI